MCKRTGAVVEVVPSDESGEIDLAALEGMLSEGGVKVVAITHVPTNGGVVNPAKEGEDASEYSTSKYFTQSGRWNYTYVDHDQGYRAIATISRGFAS